MRLKKLEIHGFKSFADRTEIVFNQGITGIVGPNGSGKSNIGDAVRWVLGEQSAKLLRGSSMQDVIFNGTQKRKPLSYCEVSLVFDNEDRALPMDYAEIMVTRRVYRTGESEYFLNRSVCRLKDVIDLFRDTGIGKEGYSIIGQGRIDEILSRKGEDRRLVFEEAAGIVKFRARKEEADRKLAHTKENLDRVDDILEELNRRLAPLEEDAKNARIYLELSAELKQLDLKGKKAVCILSGGNMDVTTMGSMIQNGLIQRGRVFTVSIRVPDKPGQIASMTAIAAEHKANILRIDHNRWVSPNRALAVEVVVTFESFDVDHKREIIKALNEAGFRCNEIGARL